MRADRRRSLHIAEAKNQAVRVLQSYPQQPPADTAAVCDLEKNPSENSSTSST
jgi:urea transport system substrate-binding protein